MYEVTPDNLTGSAHSGFNSTCFLPTSHTFLVYSNHSGQVHLGQGSLLPQRPQITRPQRIDSPDLPTQSVLGVRGARQLFSCADRKLQQ